MKPKIILASQSIGRRGLLKKLGLPFEVKPSLVDEDKILDQNPHKMIQIRAKMKVNDVAFTLTKENPANSFLIIAADSMAVLDGKTYGKSKDKEHSGQMVRALMGKTHEFVTATTIIHIENGQEISRWENMNKAYVTTKMMTDAEIEEYTSHYDFSRFAAAYTFNETPWDWITKIDGSYTNVIGLPFEVLLPILRELGYLE